jgi:hypothetical protein
MSDTPEQPEEAPKSRKWFVILAVVTLVGFAIFVTAITVLAIRIPEMKKPKYGALPQQHEARPA